MTTLLHVHVHVQYTCTCNSVVMYSGRNNNIDHDNVQWTLSIVDRIPLEQL